MDLDTEDPAREPPSLSESEWQPTIVTAFSSNHLEVGLLFLRSVGRAAVGQSAYNISIVVWTMNEFPPSAKTAFACVIEELQSLYKVRTEVRAFPFEAWPSWMRINQKRGYNGGRGKSFVTIWPSPGCFLVISISASFNPVWQHPKVDVNG